ncbi:MAG TPA: hypothetical protein VEU62_18325 [Bryobacterales bacterium]|nr:hypothetical protein [Bryobacterales bacterium]
MRLETSSGVTRIRAGAVTLEGNLVIPEAARGVILFAHGSGSSRHSPRNRHVAEVLQNAGFGTLLMDLLTADEEAADAVTAHLRFNIGMLARRLVASPAGSHTIRTRETFGSATSARAPEPPRRWSQRQLAPIR